MSARNLSSKAVVILIGVFCFSLGAIVSNYLVINNSKSKKVTSSESQLPKQYEPLVNDYYSLENQLDHCNSETCLIGLSEWNTVGLASLRGYYKRHEQEVFGNTTICDALVVTGGSNRLIETFNTIVNSGNTVNTKTEDGSLLINLNLSNTSPLIAQKITNSSPSNPIALKVLRHSSPGRGASPCASFIDVIAVESTQ